MMDYRERNFKTVSSNIKFIGPNYLSSIIETSSTLASGRLKLNPESYSTSIIADNTIDLSVKIENSPPKILVLDCRPILDHVKSHIQGSVNIYLPPILKRRLEKNFLTNNCSTSNKYSQRSNILYNNNRLDSPSKRFIFNNNTTPKISNCIKTRTQYIGLNGATDNLVDRVFVPLENLISSSEIRMNILNNDFSNIVFHGIDLCEKCQKSLKRINCIRRIQTSNKYLSLKQILITKILKGYTFNNISKGNFKKFYSSLLVKKASLINIKKSFINKLAQQNLIKSALKRYCIKYRKKSNINVNAKSKYLKYTCRNNYFNSNYINNEFISSEKNGKNGKLNQRSSKKAYNFKSNNYLNFWCCNAGVIIKSFLAIIDLQKLTPNILIFNDSIDKFLVKYPQHVVISEVISDIEDVSHPEIIAKLRNKDKLVGPTELLPWLFLGSQQHARNLSNLRALNISSLLNVGNQNMSHYQSPTNESFCKESNNQFLYSNSYSNRFLIEPISNSLEEHANYTPLFNLDTNAILKNALPLKYNETATNIILKNHKLHNCNITADFPFSKNDNISTDLTSKNDSLKDDLLDNHFQKIKTTKGDSKFQSITKRLEQNTIESNICFKSANLKEDCISVEIPLKYYNLKRKYLDDDADDLAGRMQIDCKTTNLNLDIEDTMTCEIGDKFNIAIQFIESIREEKKKVLVHCHAGISRSATICIAYLMSIFRISLDDAYEFVRKRRPFISPNLNFLGQLQDFEKRLRERRNSPVLHNHKFIEDNFNSEKNKCDANTSLLTINYNLYRADSNAIDIDQSIDYTSDTFLSTNKICDVPQIDGSTCSKNIHLGVLSKSHSKNLTLSLDKIDEEMSLSPKKYYCQQTLIDNISENDFCLPSNSINFSSTNVSLSDSNFLSNFNESRSTNSNSSILSSCYGIHTANYSVGTTQYGSSASNYDALLSNHVVPPTTYAPKNIGARSNTYSSNYFVPSPKFVIAAGCIKQACCFSFDLISSEHGSQPNQNHNSPVLSPS